MAERTFEAGDLVKILRANWIGCVGIITRPISDRDRGHVVLHKDGAILGMDASLEDVELADEKSEGFAQLGYHLIKLGSHVIEQKLIVYRS